MPDPNANPMMPGDGGAAPMQPQPAPAPAVGASGAPPSLETQHDQLVAKYSKATEARAMLDKVRLQMDSLAKLGDSVTPEDVIKSAGKLVAAGLEPNAMASLLADMPQNAEALQSWIASHDQQVTQREQQLDQVHGAIQHQMGATGLRLLMQNKAKEMMAGAGAMGGGGTAPAAGSNPLGGALAPGG